MESSHLRLALQRLADRIASAWEQDPALRDDVRNILQALWDDNEPAQAESEKAGAANTVEAKVPVLQVSAEKLQELQHAFQSGGNAFTPETAVTAKPAAPRQAQAPPALELIAERCRVKSEACLVAAARERHASEHPDAETQPFLEQLRQVIARAKALPDCFLWMCDRKYLGSVDEEGWTILAQNFANLAAAAALLAELRGAATPDRDALHEALQLVAEAQSAARCGIMGCNPQQPRFEDRDQFNTFEWLRQITNDEHYYVERHMRFDDLADATEWENLAHRLAELGSRVGDHERAGRQRQGLLGKIRYEVQRLPDSDETERNDRWKKIVAAACGLLDTGLPPSHKDLRDLLLPVIDDAPGLQDAPEPFHLIMREIDSYLAQQDRIAGNTAPQRATSPEVARVKQWLAGRSIVLIGGDERPNSARMLRDALSLSELVWLATRPHEPMDIFEPVIARADVTLVLLAIRWSSHSYAGIKVFCDRHGKHLVRLPGGYNPNQVAAQIVAQCSALLQKA